MKPLFVHVLLTALTFMSVAAVTWQAEAAGELVRFPDGFADGVLYATVTRGNLKEEIFIGRAAIDAVKKGQPIPSGSVITLVDYRDGKLFRYVVMEKRAGWGAEYPPEKRTGEWEFQAFNTDKSVNRSENLDRCFSCHNPQARQDFVFTFNRMKSAN
jgi:hypothetical protein